MADGEAKGVIMKPYEKRIVPSILVLLMLGTAPFTTGQSRETGAILGTVTDLSLEPLPGASVVLTGRNLMGSRTLLTLSLIHI